MSAAAELQPVFPTVTVVLDSGPQDELDLIDRVVAALERAGHPAGADLFIRAARGCDSADELIQVIHSTITAI